MKNIINSWRRFRTKSLNESSFSRIRQIMLGQVPSIDSVGILTAENPGGKPASPQENKQLMRDLKKSLSDMKIGYTDIGGSFGGPEKSVFIMNISRDDTTRLGLKFDQEAVIWGGKQRDQEDQPFFRFEYIEGNNTIQTRDVSLGGQEIEKRDDFYSEKGKRKFVIPFFDDEYESARQSDGGRRISFEEQELAENEEAVKIAQSINERNNYLFEDDRAPKSIWHHRNVMREEIKKLQSLLIKE